MGLAVCVVSKSYSGRILASVGIVYSHGGISPTDWTGSISLKPLINASCMEFVRTGQHSQILFHLKVTHADDTEGLIAFVGSAFVLVRGQLVNLRFGETARFCLAQSLGQTQQCLIVLRFGRVVKYGRIAHETLCQCRNIDVDIKEMWVVVVKVMSARRTVATGIDGRQVARMEVRVKVRSRSAYEAGGVMVRRVLRLLDTSSMVGG